MACYLCRINAVLGVNDFRARLGGKYMVFTGDYFDNHRLTDVTDEMIKQAEQKLKVRLPATYIELMRGQNGGELINRKLVFEDEEIAVEYINGIGSKSGEGILLSSTLKREWGLSNRLVYLHGDSHTWIALDYRRYKGDNPPVVYVDLEAEEKRVVARNFAEFMGLLVFDEDISGSSYVYGAELDELDVFAREIVEEGMKKCQDAYLMSAGMEYYFFTDEDLTWAFEQVLAYVEDFLKEGYEPYKREFRNETMLDVFLDCTIGVIRRRGVDIREYDAAMKLLKLLCKFPKDYDYQGMIGNKAQKIFDYYKNRD